MSNELEKTDKSLTEGTNAIEDLVKTAKEKFANDFPDKSQRFEGMVWNVKGLREHPSIQRNSKMYFTRFGTQNQALPTIYADVVKSWIVLGKFGLATMTHRCTAARVLWEAILLRRGNDPTAFYWRDLCEEDLNQTELLMSETWGKSTVYTRGSQLLAMTNFLAARSICRQLYYTLYTPCPGDFSKHTFASQEARKAKLPSIKALEGVADIYSTYAKDPPDRLRACALAILVVTGFRLGELLTLPLECEVTEISDGKPRYGLRYYKEKARGAEKAFDVRWLTPTAAELVQKALIEIRNITTPAREQAKILEKEPNHVSIPSYQSSGHMSPDELANVLGLKSRNTVYRIPSDKIPRHQKDGKFFYLTSEVEAYLLAERVDPLWTVDRKNGTYQMLSETLFIAFGRSFRRDTSVNPLLVEGVTGNQLVIFITGESGNKSGFERFSIQEENGKFCRISSHQFRHWLNDLADKGGLSTDLQTRWLGRENPKDTQAYQHSTVEEKLQWLKNGVKSGEICGTIASVYFALPEDERDVFLDGQIQAVHFTPLGLCIHDFAIDPCPYYLNCVRGCSEYLRTKGNQQERMNLIQVQRRTKQALEVAKSQAEENGGVAQAWIQHYEDTLVGVQAALAIDDDPTVGNGTTIQPFKDQTSRFQPL